MSAAGVTGRRRATVKHGAADVGPVVVEAYNAEIKDARGFVGDRASQGAFRAILDGSRARLRRLDRDPLGDTPTKQISKQKLDRALIEGEPEAAGVVQGAIEAFSGELATVVTRLLASKTWGRVERIAVGGGLRASRVGEVVIGRTSVRLKTAGRRVELVPIHHHPDEAALLGAAYLAPRGLLSGHGGLLAVDIGGSNVRVGLVTLTPHGKPDLARSEVEEIRLWRHADARPRPSRDDAVEFIVETLRLLARRAEKQGIDLAPFVGIACPGKISGDGRIERGDQNLPGDWSRPRFRLANRVRAGLARLGGRRVVVVLHNDAVVQGLSEIPFMRDVRAWGVLTVGTGLGNAKFRNRAPRRRDGRRARR